MSKLNRHKNETLRIAPPQSNVVRILRIASVACPPGAERSNTIALLRLTVVLTVAALLLTSCGGRPATAAPDTQAPVPYVTSGASSTSASYVLTGVSVDDTATTTVTVEPAGGATVTATLDDNEFSATLTLQPGVNSLLITAT